MQVFCTQCGQRAEGELGKWVACSSCHAKFEVPADLVAPSSLPSASLPASIQTQTPARLPLLTPPLTANGNLVVQNSLEHSATTATAMTPLQAKSAEARIQRPGQKPDEVRTNSSATTSLVMGCLCCLPGISPVVGLFCGVSAIREIQASKGRQKGMGLAITGIVLGCINLTWQVVALIDYTN
jgi:hypothetical protein